MTDIPTVPDGEFPQCMHEGCTSHDTTYYVHPSTFMGEDAPGYENPIIEYLCDQHAKEFGYCLGCGSFCAGTEDYDFSPIEGYCGECVEDMRIEAGEYDDDYEDDYDDDDY